MVLVVNGIHARKPAWGASNRWGRPSAALPLHVGLAAFELSCLLCHRCPETFLGDFSIRLVVKIVVFLLGPLNTRCHTIIGAQKGTIILTTNHTGACFGVAGCWIPICVHAKIPRARSWLKLPQRICRLAGCDMASSSTRTYAR